jgi:hypothetical protein
MQPSDSTVFLQELAELGEVYEKPLSPAVQVIYFQALADLDLAAVIDAMQAAVRTCTFMPKPAELRKLALGDNEDAAERAWMGFRAAMRSVGSYASLITGDPVLGETILAMFGSWPAACQADLSPEMWAAKRKEFGRIYRIEAERGLVGVRYLAGICEQQNAGMSAWTKHVPVHRLDGHAIHALNITDAENVRIAIAASSHGLSRLASEVD